jgi:ubiquinone/menaquinone biosynthesis C-methylase UbiE
MGHRFNPKKASKLLDPKRKELIQPETVIRLLEIKENEIIADLGAGNGYFSVPIAKKVIGELYAVDIEPKMLKLLKEQADSEAVKNIVYVEGNLEDIPLENESIDKILIAFVTHEIPNLKKAIQEFKRILKPNGKLLVLEWDTVQSEIGPPLSERIPSEDLKNQFEQDRFKGRFEQINEQMYALVFNKS